MKTKLLTICLLLFASQAFCETFPIGTFEGKSLVITGPGMPVNGIHSDELASWENSITTKVLNSGEISYQSKGSMVMHKGADTVYPEANFKGKIIWESKNSGKFVNSDGSDLEPDPYFKILTKRQKTITITPKDFTIKNCNIEIESNKKMCEALTYYLVKPVNSDAFVKHMKNYYSYNELLKRCDTSGALDYGQYNNFKKNMKSIVKYHQKENGISDENVKKYKKQANELGKQAIQEVMQMSELTIGFGRPKDTLSTTQFLKIYQYCSETVWTTTNMLMQLDLKLIKGESKTEKNEEPDF